MISKSLVSPDLGGTSLRHDADEIGVALEKALAELTARYNSNFINEIRPIVEASKRACRLSRVLRHGDPDSVMEYVERIVKYYSSERPRLRRLLRDKDAGAWEALNTQARKIAWGYMKRTLPGRPTHTLVNDVERIVGETMITVLEENYHYDTGFDRWLTVVVINLSRKEIDRKIVPRNGEIEVDAYDNWLENLEQLRFDTNPKIIELRYDLEKAIKCIPSKLHREVIELRYIHGLTPAEIAERLGRSTNSIYKAHHYALKKLRTLLLNDEEDEE